MSRLVGIVALLGVTVALATMVAVGASTWSLDSSPPTAAFSMTADGESSTITIDHDGGETIDVSEAELIVDIDGDELAAQPPVPFVGADGFDGTPDGPFNAEGDTEWEPGERAAFTIAETNDPALESGETVAVTLSVDGYRLATLKDEAT
ncbi:type IV pilin [Natronorubrum daqingense]|uniref:Type IV pilin n=1 Tax=Natronorubrum daqingense TaxID=588898 RepID=A0A1P8RI10_9EURY|nr:type IV pilin [Natronorubrum daqingense]APX98306.1 type IV pilin [Natronorubrum daqingense]